MKIDYGSIKTALSSHARVVVRPDGPIVLGSEYEQAIRQYATGSAEDADAMRPACVIYPATQHDIVEVLAFARRNKISVAIRSGGHSFQGSSSAGGPDVQLDTTHCAACTVWRFDEASKQLTIGTGWRLGAVEQNMQSNYLGYPTRGYFFAHGNCATVGVGGHMHTGGIAMQSRSFGLFVDYVVRFTIITADAVVRTIAKPDPANPNPDNDDIWFAVLGGGPGNFGVITDVTLRLLHNDQFPAARAYMQTYVWSPSSGTALLKDLLQHLAEINDKDELPADFCLHVSAVSAAPKYFTWSRILKDAAVTARALVEQGLDTVVRRSRLPPLRGLARAALGLVRSLLGNSQGRNPLFEASIVPLIIVQATWNNLSGKKEDYNDAVRAYFKRLDDIAAPHLPRGLLARLLRRAMRIIDPGKPLAITEIINQFTFKGDREFELPFFKRNWINYATDLNQRGFAERTAPMMEPFTRSIFSRTSEPWQGAAIVFTWGYLGGTRSAIPQNAAATNSAMPHRGGRVAWISDCFYDPEVAGAREWVIDWAAQNERRVVGSQEAIFSTRDARSMYDVFANVPESKIPVSPVMEKIHNYCYDSEDVYQRVLAIKRRFDPDGLFSASSFSLGGRRRG